MGFFSRIFGGAESRARELAARLTESEAADELERIGEPAVPALRALRPHPDGPTRRAAVFVLARIGSPAALDGVADALGDPDAGFTAALALANTGDRRALDPLTSLLRSTHDRDKLRAVVQGLGRVGDESTIALLEAHPSRKKDSLGSLHGYIQDAIDRIRMREPLGERALRVARDVTWRMADADFAAVFMDTRERALERWAMPKDAYPPPLHMMVCDLCSSPMFHNDHQRSLRVPAVHFKECVRYGYNPVLTVLTPREQLSSQSRQLPSATSLGEQLDKMQAQLEAKQASLVALNRDGLAGYLAAWKQMVNAATTDWALCPTCARDLGRWLWDR